MQKGKLTNDDLREHLEESIKRMREIVDTEDAGKATNAANAISGLVARYKDLFGTEITEPIKMKAVKNF